MNIKQWNQIYSFNLSVCPSIYAFIYLPIYLCICLLIILTKLYIYLDKRPCEVSTTDKRKKHTRSYAKINFYPSFRLQCNSHHSSSGILDLLLSRKWNEKVNKWTWKPLQQKLESEKITWKKIPCICLTYSLIEYKFCLTTHLYDPFNSLIIKFCP